MERDRASTPRSIVAPQGKGLLPGADVREGGNLRLGAGRLKAFTVALRSAPGVIWPSGDWEFLDNKHLGVERSLDLPPKQVHLLPHARHGAL